MPAVAFAQDLQDVEAKLAAIGCSTTEVRAAAYLYLKTIAHSEDLIQTGPVIPRAQLDELANPRHGAKDVANLERAQLCEPVVGRAGWVEIRDFERRSGAELLQRRLSDIRSEAGKKGAEASKNGRAQERLAIEEADPGGGKSGANESEAAAAVACPPLQPPKEKENVGPSKRSSRNGKARNRKKSSLSSVHPVDAEIAALQSDAEPAS